MENKYNRLITYCLNRDIDLLNFDTVLVINMKKIRGFWIKLLNEFVEEYYNYYIIKKYKSVRRNYLFLFPKYSYKNGIKLASQLSKYEKSKWMPNTILSKVGFDISKNITMSCRINRKKVLTFKVSKQIQRLIDKKAKINNCSRNKYILNNLDKIKEFEK